jgi:cytochrome c oxidase cbb3-type subunit 3
VKALAIALVAMLALLASACGREERKLSKEPSSVPSPKIAAAQGELQPGAAGAGLGETVSSRSYDGENAYELSQGKQLFRWYNCSGCHSQGGGGMGPALMENRWIYGHEPDQIFKTIMEGRPNGMPAFHGRIPEAQVWQLVGYVRSLSGLAPKAAAPGRNDSLAVTKPESERAKSKPRDEPAKP